MNKQLIEALKNKDNKAFEQIYYETNKLVFSIIASIIKDDDTIADLMQETYIKMVRNINQYDSNKSFKTWLGTIARNTAIDFYRKNQHIVQVDITDEEGMVYQAKEIDLDLEHYAFELLEILSEDERIIVLLRVIDELSFKEIANIVDRPLGTVLWSYQNSMNKLSKEYKKAVR